MSIEIFISYKKEDQQIAENVCNYINKKSGYSAHIFELSDTDLADGNGISLTNRLLQGISACNQIMVIISEQTSESWWVPWEVGVGSAKELKIASYVTGRLSKEVVNKLPEYIKINPILGSEKDIDDYCGIEGFLIMEAAGQNKMMSSIDVNTYRTRLKQKLFDRRGF